MLSNIMRFSCYRHCTCSMSKNWLAIINQNYQAEKLLKRLQNNPIKNHVKFKKFPKSTHVAFSFSLVIVLVDALVQAYILGSADQYQNVVVLFAVTFCGLSQDQWWPLRFDNMDLNSEKLTTRRSTSLFHRERQSVKIPFTTIFIVFFSNGKLCQPVLLCESIISSHPVPGAKQPGIPAPRKV